MSDFIQRHDNGIKLVTRDKLNPFTHIMSVNEMLNLPFHAFLNNSTSALELYNASGLATFNIPSESHAKGLTVKDLGTKKSADLCIRHDKMVMKENKMIIRDEPFKLHDGKEYPWLTIKFPWYDDNNEIIGIFGFSVWNDKKRGISVAEALNFLTTTRLLQSPRQPTAELTTCQQIILNQIMRGKTAREIALVLSRSQRTIEHHIENIKHKTNSASKSELIEKAFHMMI